MNLPKLSFFKFFEKKEKSEYYLALVLRNEKAVAVILEEQERKLKVISSNEELFPDSVENASTEDFLNTLDKAISGAEEALPNNIETQKTIFGLKASWVEENKIKKEYLDKLKKASNELVLTPIGFLVLNEAVVSLIQKEEGAPITAILAEIGNKYISVSLVKAGKIVETKNSEIHESASYTIDTLLKHFESPEILPSRIIVYSSDEEVVQELTGHQWSKSLPFLHLPQVVNLDSNFDASAMLLGTGAQMGLGIITGYRKKEEGEVTRLEPSFVSETAETVEPAKVEPAEEIITEHSEEPKEEDVNDLSDAVAPEFFGFLENEDIAKVPQPEPNIVEPEVSENAGEEKSAFSGVFNEEEPIAENIEEIPQNLMLKDERRQTGSRFSEVVPLVKQTFAKLLKSLKKTDFKKLNFAFLKNVKGGKGILLAIPGGLIALLILLFFFFYLFAAHAKVTLNVKPDISQKDQTVTFSTNSPTDAKNNVLAAQFVTVSEDGTDTTQATGQKQTGDKAKGTVTIFNNSSDPVSLSGGTKITSSNGLDFTLDSGVSIASASGDPFSGTKPATANVNVTSSTFGSNYNLPSGTKFSIGDNPSVAGKNDNPFSGGTTKNITVVSKDDTAKLLSDLPKKLEDKAKSDLNGKVSGDQTLLPGFVSETVDKQNFDKNAGDQADNVTLNGTVTYQAVSYNKNDIVSLALNLFNSNDITINKDNLNVNVKNIKSKDSNNIDADLNIQAFLLPKIDQEALAKQVAGQSAGKAKTILGEISHVSSVDVSISPAIPLLPKLLPRNSKNISFEIKLNG